MFLPFQPFLFFLFGGHPVRIPYDKRDVFTTSQRYWTNSFFLAVASKNPHNEWAGSNSRDLGHTMNIIVALKRVPVLWPKKKGHWPAHRWTTISCLWFWGAQILLSTPPLTNCWSFAAISVSSDQTNCVRPQQNTCQLPQRTGPWRTRLMLWQQHTRQYCRDYRRRRQFCGRYRCTTGTSGWPCDLPPSALLLAVVSAGGQASWQKLLNSDARSWSPFVPPCPPPPPPKES